jgi:hypothetical protein
MRFWYCFLLVLVSLTLLLLTVFVIRTVVLVYSDFSRDNIFMLVIGLAALIGAIQGFSSR